MPVKLSVIFGSTRQQVAPTASLTPTTIPGEFLAFECEGADLPAVAILDGVQRDLVLNATRDRGHFVLDATRSVGYHYLQVADTKFYFATDDAKLRLAGVLAMLEQIQQAGLSWGQQIVFADGTTVRDPRVDFAWLDRRVKDIVQLAREISERPRREQRAAELRGSTRAGRLMLVQTLSLVRQQGKIALEEHERGIIEFRNRRYAPRLGVVRGRELTLETIGNLRMTQLLGDCETLAREVLRAEGIAPPAKAAVKKMLEDISEARELRPFSTLRCHMRAIPDKATPREMADERYAAAADIDEEMARELAWHPGQKVADTFAYVGYSDAIYEAYVVKMLGDAAGAAAAVPTFRGRLTVPVRQSDRFDFYYDTVPPFPEFKNWRQDSVRPAAMTPDLSIVDRAQKRGLLLDAKYRVDASGRAPSHALSECQIYMQSFGVGTIVVCYPGAGPRVQEVAARGFRIIEVSIGPFQGVADYVKNDVWPRIVTIMEPVAA